MANDSMTDEQIDNFVSLVEVAEVLAKTLDMSVTQAMKTMLKSWQVMARLQQRKSIDFLSQMPTSERKQ